MTCPYDTDGDGNCPYHSHCASGTPWPGRPTPPPIRDSDDRVIEDDED